MRGHVLKRNGTWSFAHDPVPAPAGQRRQDWRGGSATKRDAHAALEESLARHAQGGHSVKLKLRVQEFLITQWPPSLYNLRSNRWRSHETPARLRELRHLGEHPLKRLRRSGCDNLDDRLQEPYAMNGQSLSATIGRIHVPIRIQNASVLKLLGSQPARVASAASSQTGRIAG